MKKLKLMTVIGTRPEIIKMSEVIKRCDEVFEHILVHTGQNYDYELNQVFFDDLGLREPDHYLNVVGIDLGETMGNVLARSYALMREVRPDALIVLGDTNSCLCVISAKRLKIPIFHMEAGNRCFDENLPEEVNRRIVDTTSDVNLCYSEHARRNLAAMGCDPARTFVVGSPMREVLSAHAEKIDASDVLGRLGLEKGGYLLLSAHREENIDDERNFAEMVGAVNALAEEFGRPVLYSMHPRSRRFIEERGVEFHPLVRAHKPFGFHDYVQLQRNAFCVVSDSGTLAEESAILGFPAVSLRTSTERPEAIDAGAFTLGSLSSDRVIQSVRVETTLSSNSLSVPSYSNKDMSSEVIKIVQGFTSYVERSVWRRACL
ncbi:non-hydrolyzing UDP-N-acetylglucosamine 2-epimerase [Gordonibacter massiliensis (ex Traore et al. 2017)]|uniref:non-hydrolyzing UDP-N-acetylglucosamine 2-epimerase n=1 Tax=Gordonibacter massiliensis (ex Traore et al. 2017) TaxID=1841863 RepID=UPI001C8B2042|nr:UDP-N-acetylglucosamine 2-epimerase (non-hydrolyzing) [Gordonibacter massiliensis (ex Traore et al. 2017)]MBX9034608.1 UDP-N-acetylglucosamine 2-epimerase (non-hydrolyzing) [Gordonibacter massiliensis (ex Traore et al. 2017)]